jgi:hypothetical protein
LLCSEAEKIYNWDKTNFVIAALNNGRIDLVINHLEGIDSDLVNQAATNYITHSYSDDVTTERFKRIWTLMNPDNAQYPSLLAELSNAQAQEQEQEVSKAAVDANKKVERIIETEAKNNARLHSTPS